MPSAGWTGTSRPVGLPLPQQKKTFSLCEVIREKGFQVPFWSILEFIQLGLRCSATLPPRHKRGGGGEGAQPPSLGTLPHLLPVAHPPCPWPLALGRANSPRVYSGVDLEVDSKDRAILRTSLR